MNLKMPERNPDLRSPITGLRIKEGSKTYEWLVTNHYLNKDGTVKASETMIANAKKSRAAATAERTRVRKLRMHGSPEERIDLALADIKTAEQAVRITGKVCTHVKKTFGSEIKSLSEGISALTVDD